MFGESAIRAPEFHIAHFDGEGVVITLVCSPILSDTVLVFTHGFSSRDVRLVALIHDAVR